MWKEVVAAEVRRQGGGCKVLQKVGATNYLRIRKGGGGGGGGAGDGGGRAYLEETWAGRGQSQAPACLQVLHLRFAHRLSVDL